MVVERAVLGRGWRVARSPADADVLVVCGTPGPRLFADLAVGVALVADSTPRPASSRGGLAPLERGGWSTGAPVRVRSPPTPTRSSTGTATMSLSPRHGRRAGLSGRRVAIGVRDILTSFADRRSDTDRTASRTRLSRHRRPAPRPGVSVPPPSWAYLHSTNGTSSFSTAPQNRLRLAPAWWGTRWSRVAAVPPQHPVPPSRPSASPDAAAL